MIQQTNLTYKKQSALGYCNLGILLNLATLFNQSQLISIINHMIEIK